LVRIACALRLSVVTPGLSRANLNHIVVVPGALGSAHPSSDERGKKFAPVRKKSEAGRQHAEQLFVQTIRADFPSQHIRVGVEVLSPIIVRENHFVSV